MFGLKKQKKYNPLKYWNERADPNNDIGRSEDRVRTDVEFIGRHLENAQSVFELGPGVGRTFQAYSPGMQLQTLDISKIYANQLSTNASAKGLNLHQNYLEAPLARFPFDDHAFDVGVSCQVFLHQPPEIFHNSISEMARVSKRLILISGFHSTFPETATTAIEANHVFSHDMIFAVQSLGRRCLDVMSAHRILYLYVE